MWKDKLMALSASDAALTAHNRLVWDEQNLRRTNHRWSPWDACWLEKCPSYVRLALKSCWHVPKNSRDGEAAVGAFQTGYIALRMALGSENNHGRHIEGSFQTEVLKTSHFKGPFGMKDFEGYNWWTLWAPMILCADSLHDDGASVWARDDDAKGHFKKQLFGPLHPSTLQSSHSGG